MAVTAVAAPAPQPRHELLERLRQDLWRLLGNRIMTRCKSGNITDMRSPHG